MKRIFLKTLHFIYIRILRIFKPISIGVRVMLIRDDEILLVKHTYQDEWYFPGGGTKKFETLDQAARREAYEEVGATLNDLELLGVFTNFLQKRTDHIAVFICKDFTLTEQSDWEIEDTKFFPLNAPPKNIAEGIGRHLQNYLADNPAAIHFGRW